jgi:DNA-binding NarL/FixJ family response regulator
MFDKEYYEKASLEAGADAYVMKQSAADDLVRVIRGVAGVA